MTSSCTWLSDEGYFYPKNVEDTDQMNTMNLCTENTLSYSPSQQESALAVIVTGAKESTDYIAYIDKSKAISLVVDQDSPDLTVPPNTMNFNISPNDLVQIDEASGTIRVSPETMPATNVYTVSATKLIGPDACKLEKTIEIQIVTLMKEELRFVGRETYSTLNEETSTIEIFDSSTKMTISPDNFYATGVEFSVSPQADYVRVDNTDTNESTISIDSSKIAENDLKEFTITAEGKGVLDDGTSLMGIKTYTLKLVINRCTDFSSRIKTPQRPNDQVPYQISHWTELLYLSLSAPLPQDQKIDEPTLGDDYILTNDITLPHRDCVDYPTSTLSQEDLSFVPIGDIEKPFTGTFDGNEKKIIALNIMDEERIYAGLFGVIGVYSDPALQDLVVHDLVVHDLSLVGPTVSTGAITGSLVGWLAQGAVDNVHAIRDHFDKKGSVISRKQVELPSVTSPKGSFTGGVVGASDGIIRRSSSALSVSSIKGIGEDAAGGVVGGLVGYTNGLVSGYATGSVSTVGNEVGGLVGLQTSKNSRITGYATGNVFGNRNTGGLVGLQTNSSSTATGYATGNVGGDLHVGGLVGQAHGNIYGYARGTVSGKNRVGGLIGIAYFTKKIPTKKIGYARGNVKRKSGSSTTFGKVVGAQHYNGISYEAQEIPADVPADNDTSALETYTFFDTATAYLHSNKDQESNIFDANNTKLVIDTSNYGQALLLDLNTKKSDWMNGKQKAFGVEDTEGKWEIKDGHWPAINLSELSGITNANSMPDDQPTELD